MPTLRGEYECKIDDKGRLRLPVALFQCWTSRPDTFIFLRWFDGQLALFDQKSFSEWSAPILKIPASTKDSQELHRFINATTEQQPDANDRLLIPRRLAAFAQLTDEIIVIGNGTHIELWEKERFDARFNSAESQYSTLLERVLNANSNLHP